MSFYLQENKSKKLILFITGWGIDERPTLFMDDGKFDILTLYDYPSLNHKIEDFNFEQYDEITLVAWSLGVLAANIYFGELQLNFERCIAINGTGLPVDDKFGIPRKVFDLTLKTWSEKAREKFNLRMCGGRSEFERFTENFPQRSIQNQRLELEWCYQKALTGDQYNSLKWDLSIIGMQDKIFPSENMTAYWAHEGTVIKKINSAHYPFFQWNSWTEFINEISLKRC